MISDQQYEAQVQALTPGNHGLTLEQRNRLAYHLEDRVVRRSEVASAAFVDNGRDLWRLFHYDLYRELGYQTFDEWLYLPQVNVTKSSGYLAIQMIDLFTMFFRIPTRDLYGIGEKKYQLIVPYVAGLQRDVLLRAEVGSVEEWYAERLRGQVDAMTHKVWHLAQQSAQGWLEDGQSMSYNALLMRGLKRRGWTVHANPSVPMYLLRQSGSVDELLAWLNLSELPDDVEVTVTVKSLKPLPVQPVGQDQ